MASIEIQDSLCNQETFEDGCNSRSSFSDNIKMLKLLISILKSCLGCMLKWHIRQENVLARLKHIDDVVENVYRDFEQLHADSGGQVSGNEGWRSSATNQELVLANLTRLKIIEPDMKEIYLIVAVAPTRKLDSVKSVFDCIFWPFKICLNCMKLSLDGSQIIDPSAVVSKASDVVRFLDSLLKILKEMVSNKADLIAAVEQQIAALEDRLRFFRNFLWLVVKQCKNEKHLRDLLTYAEVFAVHVACWLYLCLVCDKMNGNVVEEMKNELLELVEKIKPLKPEIRGIHLGALSSLTSSEAHDTALIDEHYLGFVDSLLDYLRELPNNQVYCLSLEMDYMEILIDELHLLRFNLLDPPHPAVDDFTCEHQALMVHMQAVINKIVNYFCLLYVIGVNEDTTWRLNLVLFSVLEEIECIKKEATDLYDKFIPKSWRSYFPRTNELGFLEVFIKNLKERVECNQSAISPFGNQIEVIYVELETTRKIFREISEQRNESVELTDVSAHIKDVAYHAECVVDSVVAKARSCWCHQLGLFEVTKEIMIIQKELKSIRKKIAADSTCLVSSIDSAPRGNAGLGSNDWGRKNKVEAIKHLVGHETTEKNILEQVTRGSKQLNILSIVGMPGIGKTTLANCLYENHLVTKHFHVRAWCCVSQVYQKDILLRDILLLDILGQILGNTNQVPQSDTQDHVDKVYRSLKGRRYLIVLDDIWDIEVWNFLKGIFPDDRKGSRILLTSRDHNVALKASSVPYDLSPLSDEQSWELLCIKVFEKENCPQELSKVGKQIAKNCKGLPFAVVLIAGVLKTTVNSREVWEQVEKSFRSNEVNNPLEEYHVSALEVSYQHLPNYLKPCFLYFGAFREDAEIPVSKLLWIWIAEGFIHQSNPIQNSLENEAENYLNNLIYKSLVMVVQRSSTGGVKSCRVHDLLRDFCLRKAEQENFLLHVNRYDGHSTNSSDLVAHNPYRLCIDSNSHAVSMGTFTLRSLLFSSWLYEELPFVDLIEFRLLRVLDLSNVRIFEGIGAEEFVKVTDLVHLRFLAIPICHPEVPPQIMNLQNLETLIIIMVKRSVGITLPVTIWNLIKLRHLHVKNGHFSFRGPEFFDHFSKLHNLETLSTIEFFLKNYFERLTSSLSGLRKLACLVSYMLLDPLIISLNQVETLKLHFDGEVKLPLKFNPNSNLKKLTLLNFRRPWNEISIIGQLPNLEVLKLEDRAYVGRQWDMREGEFQNLKFLKLSKLDIQVWNASNDHLPSLQRLVLHSCLCLEEIPPDFGDIITLEYIEVKKYNKSVLQSLVQIEKQQHDNNNDQFKFSVFSREMGSASSSQCLM